MSGVDRELVGEVGVSNLLCMSRSSGSQMMPSMFLRARDEEKLPMPAAQYLCMPAAELHLVADSTVVNASWHGFNWEHKMPEAVKARAVVRDFLEEKRKRDK
jgi:acetyl esterase/lipase